MQTDKQTEEVFSQTERFSSSDAGRAGWSLITCPLSLSPFKWRNIIAMLAVVCGLLATSTAFAQTATDGDYRSVATGNWSDITKWQVRSGGSWAAASTSPTSANNVYLQTGFTITVDSSTVACNDLHINTGGVLTIGANTVQVNGKIRAYTGTAVTTAGVDGTFYSGQTITTSPGTSSITSSGSGKLSIVGNSRTVFNTGEWGANTTGYAQDVSMNSGQTATSATSAKAASWTISSGTFAVGLGSYRFSGSRRGGAPRAPGTRSFRSGRLSGLRPRPLSGCCWRR